TFYRRIHRGVRYTGPLERVRMGARNSHQLAMGQAARTVDRRCDSARLSWRRRRTHRRCRARDWLYKWLRARRRAREDSRATLRITRPAIGERRAQPRDDRRRVAVRTSLKAIPPAGNSSAADSAD